MKTNFCWKYHKILISFLVKCSHFHLATVHIPIPSLTYFVSRTVPVFKSDMICLLILHDP